MNKNNLKIVIFAIVAILLVTIIVIVLPKPNLKNNDNKPSVQNKDEEYVPNNDLWNF